MRSTITTGGITINTVNCDIKLLACVYKTIFVKIPCSKFHVLHSIYRSINNLNTFRLYIVVDTKTYSNCFSVAMDILAPKIYVRCQLFILCKIFIGSTKSSVLNVLYRKQQKFHGTKLSRFSRIFNKMRKFSLLIQLGYGTS